MITIMPRRKINRPAPEPVSKAPKKAAPKKAPAKKKVPSKAKSDG